MVRMERLYSNAGDVGVAYTVEGRADRLSAVGHINHTQVLRRNISHTCNIIRKARN